MFSLNRDNLATWAGAAIAIFTAWQTIDWANFSFEKEWPKLVITGLIALKGYMVEFKAKKNANNKLPGI